MSAVAPQAMPAHAGTLDEDGDDAKKPSATQRLAQSRERLRLWMVRGDARQDAKRRVAAAESEGETPRWLDRLRTLPVVGLAIDVMSSWWSNHPLHAVSSLTADAIGRAVRRHPFIAMGAAFAAGAVLVRWRPWRWVVKPALFGGIASELVSHLVSQVPLDSWISALGSFTEPARHDADSDTIRDPAAPSEAAPQAASQTNQRLEDALSP